MKNDNNDMASRTITGTAKTSFTYTGNLMDSATGGGESFDLDWDDNGNMIIGVDANLVYNWDDKLRSADSDGNEIALKYDPSGNRIYKNSSEAGQRKYIVDIVGDLPVILLELDTSNNVKKTYIYANSQIITQHDGNDSNPRYFYLHDRLGSVRQIIDTGAKVVKLYTYNPFGETLETDGTLDNAFMFTGQYYDAEIDEYYLRARQYDPHIGRFTSRDTVFGKFEEPLTLHAYLYCINDPVTKVDPTGQNYSGALAYAREVVTAANARNLAFASVLSSNRNLFQMAISLATISNAVADYVDEGYKIDYSSGPHAFLRFQVTRTQCRGPEREAAIWACNEQIGITAMAASGQYQILGLVTAPTGAVATGVGLWFITHGNFAVGLPVFGVAVVIDAAAVYSLYKTGLIKENSKQAIENFCNCDRFEKNSRR